MCCTSEDRSPPSKGSLSERLVCVPFFTRSLSCHPIHDLIPLLGRHQLQEAVPPAPIPRPLVRPAHAHDPNGPRPPQADAHHGGNGEARDGKQQPVLPHPEDGLRVAAVPAAAAHDVEEAPAVALVLVGHQHADALGGRPVRSDVLLPDHREEERARTVHDCDVRHAPVAVVGLQRLDHAQEEGVLRHRAHGIVADARRHREADPGWVAEEGVEPAVAAIVQVHVGAAIVGEDEVADGVGALDWEGVVVKGLDEPWVLCGNEFA